MNVSVARWEESKKVDKNQSGKEFQMFSPPFCSSLSFTHFIDEEEPEDGENPSKG